jgi:hypothetical protein
MEPTRARKYTVSTPEKLGSEWTSQTGTVASSNLDGSSSRRGSNASALDQTQPQQPLGGRDQRIHVASWRSIGSTNAISEKSGDSVSAAQAPFWARSGRLGVGFRHVEAAVTCPPASGPAYPKGGLPRLLQSLGDVRFGSIPLKNSAWLDKEFAPKMAAGPMRHYNLPSTST